VLCHAYLRTVCCSVVFEHHSHARTSILYTSAYTLWFQREVVKLKPAFRKNLVWDGTERGTHIPKTKNSMSCLFRAIIINTYYIKTVLFLFIIISMRLRQLRSKNKPSSPFPCKFSGEKTSCAHHCPKIQRNTHRAYRSRRHIPSHMATTGNNRTHITMKGNQLLLCTQVH
jgi:hypothetical protein